MDRPSRKGCKKMTVDLALEWVVWTTKQSPDLVRKVFTDDQIVTLGKWLCGNQLLNPPKKPRRKKLLKAVCHCGCGQSFEYTYSGGPHPKYMSQAHYMRVYRAAKKAQG